MAAAQGMLATAAACRMPFGKARKNLGRLFAGQNFKCGRGSLGISTKVKANSSKDNAETFQESKDARGPSYTWPDKQRPRVCILGGGFGGLYTALRLESLVWVDNKKPQVVLIDKSENFVFKPLLYEILSGEVEPWEIAPSFKSLLANTGIVFVQDKVTVIQPNGPGNVSPGGNVQLESGVSIEYDCMGKSSVLK